MGPRIRQWKGLTCSAPVGLLTAVAAAAAAALAGQVLLNTTPARAVTVDSYAWKNVAVGGRGFVPGIIFNQSQPNLAYARTDTGGAYRWNQATSSASPSRSASPSPSASRSASPSPTTTGGGGCTVAYTVTNQWSGGFQADVKVTNTGAAAVNGWSLVWSFANGQVINQLWSGNFTQRGAAVTVTNASYNGTVALGGTAEFGFPSSWDNTTNALPGSFTLNGARCATS